jgi:acyl carrier protein
VTQWAARETRPDSNDRRSRNAMTEDEIKAVVIEVLSDVAPNVKPDQIDPQINFRDQFDFDSMDFLNFGIGLERRLDFKIPEKDYPKLSSLNGCVAYLSGKIGAAA